GTEYSKENATIVTLCRNEDLYSMLETIQNFEDRFNSKFGYTWTFLNNEPFTEEFKALTSNICSGSTKYGLIPEYQWSYPDRINLKKVKDARKKMANLPYGSLESYNHMCRYFSGFFYKHGLLNEFKYYWRVEPDVKLYCDIDYDVFKYMRVNKKKYGFSVSLFEEPATIGTLWPTIRTFLKSTGGAGVKKNNLMDFISIDNGQTYNTCHFWSNFEIGDMDFWRSKEYESFFQYLDESGGFFYERWGDAPIHTIGAALFLDASEFHFFEDVSYFHNPVLTCPENDDMRLKGKCSCDPSKDFNAHFYVSCMDNYFKALNQDLPKHWGQY
ncbi:glycosyltransferase family 15 protein, partial [[Candida] arabinofermentans NRRL YB-2248]